MLQLYIGVCAKLGVPVGVGGFKAEARDVFKEEKVRAACFALVDDALCGGSIVVLPGVGRVIRNLDIVSSAADFGVDGDHVVRREGALRFKGH